MTGERGVYCPLRARFACLRAPFGAKPKTNDESFIQNIQLSPVLMLPSHTLRDISCFNDFKTLKSKSQKLKPPSGQASKAKSASLALSNKSIKARASNPRHLSSFGYRGFFLDPLRVNLSSASLRSETKALKMKGLKAKGTSVPSVTQVFQWLLGLFPTSASLRSGT